MAIELFEHNQRAYDNVLSMLSKTGKAAVVHPTGTGKSFIGFKLCEDNPEKRILWISPSRYIFHTQLENLKKTSGIQPNNLVFLTYARLMNLTPEELAELKPDYIVLDEFHRCGAAQWGNGVKRLLKKYKRVPLLGLSATAVRYLDSQRDMAEEIFDGCIASEMSLGEAIVRGILMPPTYVQSVFSFHDELRKYEKKVKKSGRNDAQEYLEKLRRAIEQADGLDVIFQKHMKNPTGKYIVFCANYEAMQEAMGKVSQWFRLVDKKPHVYSFYSEDDEALGEYEGFKSDYDDTHLRLLFCIDALNEGIHIRNISGVILLRPTVSPIIYKQQIGRALSTGEKAGTVIFDIVNNIEGLYSIDAIKDEMQEALFRFNDRNDRLTDLTESFEIADEVGDCMKLFKALDSALSTDWMTMYGEAKEYAKRNGNLMVPLTFQTKNGRYLGRWISTQRTNRNRLDTDKKRMLDEIGMNWLTPEENKWEIYFAALVQYRNNHGDFEVPSVYETPEGLQLGRWYRRVCEKYSHDELQAERVQQLIQTGVDLGPARSRNWNKGYALAKEYYTGFGDLLVPHDYCVNGMKLGIWVSTQRENKALGKLSEKQISMLKEIGMCWDRNEDKWSNGFEAALKYVTDVGDINSMPVGYSIDGFDLYAWLGTQRSRYKQGKLSAERVQKLESIGMSWSLSEVFWNSGYEHALQYKNGHGSLKMPVGYVCEDGFKLKSWLNNQKVKFRNGTLNEVQTEKLRVLGVV